MTAKKLATHGRDAMPLIEVSHHLLDLPFVSRTLRANKLNVVPLQGFYKDPNAWAEDANWKRTVERYDWGVIVFLSNVEAKKHATIIVQGSFDIDKGEAIREDGRRVPIPVPWYKELAKALGKKAGAHVDIKIPPCLGYHEDDVGTDNPICDGGYIQSRNITERPCAWRDRCIPFQAFCVTINLAPPEFLKTQTPEQVVQLTTRLRDEAAAKAVPTPIAAAAQASTGDGELVPAPKPAVKIASGITAGQQKGTPPAGGVAIFWEVFNSLKSKVKGHKFLTGREEASPGDIFIQDRSSSGYISLYCQPVSGRRIAIVEVRLKADRVHALFPMPHDHKLLAGLKAQPAKDGKFISMVTDIPKSISIDKLTTVLSAAITAHVIDLPKTEPKAAAANG